MDRRPRSRRTSKRTLVAVVGILAIGVVALGGLWVVLAPGPSSSQSPVTSPSAVAVASGSPSLAGSAGSSARSTAGSSAESSAESSASAVPTDSVEPGASDGGLLPADATGSVLPSASPTSAPSSTVAPTATRTATPYPPTVTPATPTPTPIPKPNLAYVWYSGIPNPTCGLPYTVSATVVNNGQVPSVATNLYLLDQYPAELTLSTAYTAIHELDVGETVTVSVTFTATISCGHTHRLVLRLDAAGNNDETSESDNWLRVDYDIRTPNLYPSDLTVAPHAPCNSVNVGVRVNNNGNAQGNSALVRFTDTVSGVPSYSKVVYASYPNIPAGTSRIVNQTFPVLSYCNRTHTLTVLVDSGGNVPERNEADNSMHVDYHPDL